MKAAYLEAEGDMDTIIDTVLCATAEDEPRFAKMLQAWIDTDEIPAFKKFTQETKENKKKRNKKRAAEAKEAEDYAKEIGLDGSADSLTQMIMKRQQNRAAEADNFFDHLAAKYGGSPKDSKKKKNKK